MIENAPTLSAQEPAQNNAGCLSQLGFHAASFVMPFASLSFYRRAVTRRTGSAVLFFILLMSIVSLLGTVAVNLNLSKATLEIRDAFVTGRVPDITIQGGVATASGPQPAILIDQDAMLVAIDTTGQLRSIDQSRYAQGFLLTRNELHVLNRGSYERLPNSQLNDLLSQDPFVLNADTAASMWQTFSNVFSLIALVGLFLWNVVVRFMYLAFLAVLVWGGASLFRKTEYSTVLITGIYAFVPAFLLHALLGKFGVNFIFLQTLILLPVWIVGLYGALAPGGWDLLGPDRPLRAWRAWIGLPLLLVMALDALFAWPRGGLIGVIAFALTGIALVAAGMFTLPSRDERAGGAGELRA